MSEVSTSVHFLGLGPQQTRKLAVASGFAGRIVATNQRWTCFVPFEDDQAMQVVLAASGVALLWTYAEDYALALSFFHGGALVGEGTLAWYEETYAPPVTPPSAELLDALAKVGVLSSEGVEQFAALTRQVAAGAIERDPVRDAAAAILGLAAYQWLSPRACLDTSVEVMRGQHPAAEDVDEDES